MRDDGDSSLGHGAGNTQKGKDAQYVTAVKQWQW